MTIISLIITLVILALIFWLVTQFLIPAIPVGPIRTAVLILFVLLCILVLLQLGGFMPDVLNTKIR